MQDAKAKVNVLPEVASSNDDTSERQTNETDHAVSIDAEDACEVEAVAPGPPADCEALPTEAEHGSSSHTSVDNCDGLLAADTETLSPTCSSFTSTSSSAAVIKSDPSDAGVYAEDICHTADTLYDDADGRVCAGDVSSCIVAVSAPEVAGLDVGTASSSCDAEFISPADITSTEDCHQTSVKAVTHDITSQLNLGSILAESFISSTQSAADLISTQATIGSSLSAAETVVSSDQRTTAPGI